MKKYQRAELEAIQIGALCGIAHDVFKLGHSWPDWQVANSCLAEIERRGLRGAFIKSLTPSMSLEELIRTALLDDDSNNVSFAFVKAGRSRRAVITAAILAVQEQEEQP